MPDFSTTHSPLLSHDDRSIRRDLLRYLVALHGRDRQGFTEVRFRDPVDPGRWRQRYYPAAYAGRTARAIMTIGRRTDTYIGVAARHRRAGHKRAIDALHVVWADLDGPAKVDVNALSIPPGIVVRSGTHEHRHLYWLLSEPVETDAAEVANRRLAALLGGDSGAVCNAAAVLRPPGTLSFKHPTATEVTLVRLRADRHRLDEVLAGIPEVAQPRTSQRRPRTDGRQRDRLLSIEPARFALALLGHPPGRDGKISCPFHEDRTPSLQLYSTGREGWYCFGCRCGGDIYDFAAELWALSTRGSEFLELQRRLREIFGLAGQPDAQVNP